MNGNLFDRFTTVLMILTFKYTYFFIDIRISFLIKCGNFLLLFNLTFLFKYFIKYTGTMDCLDFDTNDSRSR